jgi:hypothetical protein
MEPPAAADSEVEWQLDAQDLRPSVSAGGVREGVLLDTAAEAAA